MNDKIYALWLNLIKDVPMSTLYDLVDFFGSPEDVYYASEADLAENGLMDESTLRKFLSHKEIDMDSYIKSLEESNIETVTVLDDNYPANLSEVLHPPFALHYKGICGKDSFKNSLAIVGSRKATVNGLRNTFEMASEISSCGISIISGLANGIDTKAHEGALKGGGITAAVLGCGVDRCYPPENRSLYHEILDSGGGIFSEYRLGAPPLPLHFPRRNRIISGMALGVLVAEAAPKSGSLITAKFAMEQGREVYAFPGDINNRNSKGTNSMIKDGAKLVLQTMDIIEDIFPMMEFKSAENRNREKNLSQDEKILFDLIEKGYNTPDMLISKSGLTPAETGYFLTKMEIKRMISKDRSIYHIL
ncbi:DNA-processing protein DprA [Alkalibacter saccharofermentans]|uniref:DNA processing protein n=1 Tax=Alkalibacter saccharofermentans DSM 14828 TaxID=1120975 RepID=A0A1M4S617_9FIRM|nr:DNA-processing protein DprA [Alkalibacter saccharofermentans]SHE27646.1 DNA processing protein [Alkalibacter saccharofermentans DSM 14828]